MCHNFHIRGNSCLFFVKKIFFEKKSTMAKKQPTKSTPTRRSIRKKNVTRKEEKTAIVTPTKKKVSTSKYIHYILVFLNCRCTTATNLTYQSHNLLDKRT